MSLQSLPQAPRPSHRPVQPPRVARPPVSRTPAQRPRASAATVLVEVAVDGPDALQTATRLAGEIRDLVDSAGAENAGAKVSASVGLQLGAGIAGRPALAFSQPAANIVSVPGAKASRVPLPAFVAPGTEAVAPRPAVTSWQDEPKAAVKAAPASTAPDTATLRIYPSRRVALLDGEQLALTRREFDLLLFLAENAGRVFDRPQLLRLVWGHQVICGERTVDVHVRRLRSKVEGTGPVISTVRGVGYRLDSAERVAVLHES